VGLNSKAWQPCEVTITATRLGISGLFVDSHSIKLTNITSILLKNEDQAKSLIKNIGLDNRDIYTVREFILILSYCIKATDMKYSPRRIKNEYFFIN